MRPISCGLLCVLLASCAAEAAMGGDDAGVDSDGGGDTTDGGGAADAGPGSPLPSTLGTEERPATLVVPSAHDGVTPLPLLVLLHGYSASGSAQDLYLGLSRRTRAGGFYLIIPDGTVDSRGNRFWNATPACCDFDGSGVDDVGYLMSLVDELEALAPVRDVYFFGHSNGGFMSYRMGCEQADRVSAIASLAGSDFPNDTDCVPSRPVSVLQIHGDMDRAVDYAGVDGAYPSARDVVARWADRAGCEDVVTMGEPLDLDRGIPGAETTVEQRITGCDGAEAALWTIVGGSHVPALTGGDFSARLLAWLDAHGR